MNGESADGTIDRRIALLTDGGEAIQEDSDEDRDDDQEAGGVQEEAVADEQGEDAGDGSAEGAAGETTEGESDAQDIAGEAESHAEEWEEISEEIEEAEGVHRGDAETVYEGDDATGVLHLDLGGLTVDLLGLEVHLNDVVLNVGARPGENKLLGNLLSAVTGLLDGLAASPLDAVKNALGKVKNAIAGLVPSWADIKGRLAGFVPNFGGIKDRIVDRLPSLGGIKTALLGLVPGVDGAAAPEEAEDEDGTESQEDAEGEDEAAGEEAPEEAEDGHESESPGILARIRGWFGEKLRDAVSALPIQEIAANIVRELLRELIEQIESRDRPESQGGDATAEAES